MNIEPMNEGEAEFLQLLAEYCKTHTAAEQKELLGELKSVALQS